MLMFVITLQETEYNKMEKADILEMTVQHLLQLKKSPNPNPDSSLGQRYKTGFKECVQEVKRFLGSTGISPGITDHLYSHLANYMVQSPHPCSYSNDAPPNPHQQQPHNSLSTSSPKPTVISSDHMMTSSARMVPLLVQTVSHVDTLAGSPVLPSGIIPLYSQTASSQALKRSTENHSLKLSPHDSLYGSKIYRSVFSIEENSIHQNITPHLLIHMSNNHLEICPGLPGSPGGSSRGLDTPSPGSSSSEHSCVSDVWRPW